MADSPFEAVYHLSGVDGRVGLSRPLTEPLSPEKRGPVYPDDAACREVGTTLFFGEKGEAELTRMAKKVCAGCDVREECLEEALAHREAHGVWGGLTPRERNRILRGVA